MPSGQCWHAELMWLLYVPPGQAPHRDEPAEDEVPGGHSWQEDWPLYGWNVPAGQLVQAPWPAGL